MLAWDHWIGPRWARWIVPNVNRINSWALGGLLAVTGVALLLGHDPVAYLLGGSVAYFVSELSK